MNVCSICGHVKDAPFKMHIIKRPDNTYKWLCTESDIHEVYGDIPTLEGEYKNA